jgi:hypothetical protein
VATFLLAKGYQLHGVELARDGIAGECVFVFEPSAAVGMSDYYHTKESLARLMVEARRRR